MGHLKNQFGITLIKQMQPGTCPECATAHDPEEPHDQQSLAYQYRFYDKHGRWPTWADAMAHCPDDIKAFWTEALAERGVAVGEAEKIPHLTLEIEIGLGKEAGL